MAIDWQNLVFLDSDFVYLRGVFRKERRPMALHALLPDFIRYRMQAGSEETGVIAYHPYDTYMVGQKVYFPAYDESEVIQSVDPDVFLGEKCETITYRSKRDKVTRTFVAGARAYFDTLPRPERPEREATSVEEVIEQYGLAIKARLGAILAQNHHFVNFRDWWLDRDLMVDVDARSAYALVYEQGCIDSTSLAYACLGEIDLTRAEDQVKLFSLCYRLIRDRRVLYDPLRDQWRVPRLYGIQARSVGRTADNRKIILDPAPIYPDTPSVLKEIRGVEEGEMWTFQNFEESDRALLERFGEDTFEVVETTAEEWLASRPKSVSFRLTAANVLSGFLPLHAEARRLFPERATQLVLADDFGVRMNLAVDRDNRIIYNSDGLLADFFVRHRLESGCVVHIEHLESEKNYHIYFRRERTGPVSAIAMGLDKASHTPTYQHQMVEPPADAEELFRIALTPDEIDALREASISQGKNTFDLVTEELPRLAAVVAEGRVTLHQLYDAIFVRRPCQITILLSELRRHPCFVEHEGGWWAFLPDASLEPRPPELRWEPPLMTTVEAAPAEAAPSTSSQPTQPAPLEQEPAAASHATAANAPEPGVATAGPDSPGQTASAIVAPTQATTEPRRKVSVPPWVDDALKETIARFVVNYRKSDAVDPEECLDPAIFDEFFVDAFVSRRHQRYATPLEVAQFMVALADPRPGERVIDACCGTGTFLLAVLEHFKHRLRRSAAEAARQKRLTELPPAEGETEPRRMFVTDESELLHAINAICAPRVAGMDVEPMAIEGTRLRLALRGYDNTQLLMYEAVASREIIPEPTFDVVLGNPPPSEYWQENFYSRYWELVKPGGRIVALITPDVLRSEDRAEFRSWLTTYFAVDAVVELPRPKQRDLYGDALCVVALRKLYEGMSIGETVVAQVSRYNELREVAGAFRAALVPNSAATGG